MWISYLQLRQHLSDLAWSGILVDVPNKHELCLESYPGGPNLIRRFNGSSRYDYFTSSCFCYWCN